MNRIMTDYYPTFQAYQALREQLLALLTDEDLAYTVGGSNPSLGALCHEIGEVEAAYIESFHTLHLDFSYRPTTPEVERSVQALAAWFAELDDTLHTTIEGLSDEAIDQQIIDRGGGFTLPIQIQLEVYKEALLIFYGKVSVYLKAMGKTVPTQWEEWIG